MHRGDGYFSNLFRTNGDVHDGWVSWTEPVTDGTDPLAEIIANQAIGDAATVTSKLRDYASVGTDLYLYNGTWGLPFELELASIERFGEVVIPALKEASVGTR
jgi:hypothetical protein